MTPYIQQNIIGNAPQLPISEQEFEALAEARTVLNAVFELEESYDLLIGNYIEVEKELLTAAASNAVQQLTEYSDFFELRSTVNRRVVNLLTATRLYLDQTPQRLANCAVDPARARKEFEQRTNQNYDKSFNYRFLEALRNHVQHCGLAVHSIKSTNEWIRDSGKEEMEISVQPFSEKLYCSADGKFKKLVLAEMPEKVSLMLAIREYLQHIGDLHMLVRSHVNDRAQKSRQLISEQISKYATENRGVTTGLTAFRLNAHKQKESLPLFLDWDDVRLRLVSRNKSMAALGRGVVTGRVL